MIRLILSYIIFQFLSVCCQGQYSSPKFYPSTSNAYSHPSYSYPQSSNYYYPNPYGVSNFYNPYSFYPTPSANYNMNPSSSYSFPPLPPLPPPPPPPTPLYYPNIPVAPQPTLPQPKIPTSPVTATPSFPPTAPYIPSTLPIPPLEMTSSTLRSEANASLILNEGMNANGTQTLLVANSSEPLVSVANPQLPTVSPVPSTSMVTPNPSYPYPSYASPLNNAVNPTTSNFNGMPVGQPFYPPGYGSSNPFVLNPTVYNNTPTMWPQPGYPPVMYPASPYMQYSPIMPTAPSTNPTQQQDESASPTIMSSNGETGTDVNSLPPQVKEFMDMIPDILNMPESQTFAQGNQQPQQTSPVSPFHRRFPGLSAPPLHKIKSPLYRKKYYSPKRHYYNNYNDNTYNNNPYYD